MKKVLCDFCGNGGGFLKDKIELIRLHDQDTLLHRRCIPLMRQKIEYELSQRGKVKLEDRGREAYQIYTENELRQNPKKKLLTFEEFCTKTENGMPLWKKIIDDKELNEVLITDTKKSKEEKHAKDFESISYNLESGLEAILFLNYSSSRKSKTRLFFSKENNTSIFSRDYLADTSSNAIHFKIEPATRKNAKLISGGSYDFNDSFDAGYSLVVNMKYGDGSVRRQIIDILRKYGFGCLPSDFTIHAHLNKKHPTESEAKEIFVELIDNVKKIG